MPLLFQKIMVVVWFTVAGGVILPGRCPKVPTSHRFPNVTIYGISILRQVPFGKDTPSYLFQEMGPLLVPVFGVSIIGKDVLKLKYHSQGTRLAEPYALASAHMNGESITLNSSVYMRNPNLKVVEYIPMDCHKPVFEEVRLWQDAEFLIIWSCVNSSDGNHDEAVIMMEWGSTFYGEYLVLPHKSENVLKRLKTTSFKYLNVSKPLLKLIDWSLFRYTIDPRFLSPYARPFVCPSDKIKEEVLILSTIGTSVLIIGLLLWVYLKKTGCKCFA